jgi:hypothetical protein
LETRNSLLNQFDDLTDTTLIDKWLGDTEPYIKK